MVGMTKRYTTTINCQCNKTDVLNLCNVTQPCCTQCIFTCEILLTTGNLCLNKTREFNYIYFFPPLEHDLYPLSFKVNDHSKI